jgi:hypothetical protein
MRLLIIALWVLLSATSAMAQVSFAISVPGLSIGFNQSSYPEFAQVPGYPVYYAPRLGANFFYYDGMYWLFQSDNWYASSWYNGPWGLVGPEGVPLYVLRVPVRYYRSPPSYFGGWQPDAPPRWGDHWGREWEQRRSGWDRWDRNAAPRPAPLPVYQRQYSGDRYPSPAQQPNLRSRNYHYQPQEQLVRQHYQEQAPRSSTPAPEQQRPQRAPKANQPPEQQQQQETRRPQASQPPHEDRSNEQSQRRPAAHESAAQPEQQQQQAPKAGRKDAQQGKGAPQEKNRGQGQGKDDEKDRGEGGRGQNHNK